MDELQGHFGNLSMQKFGSHVVEHCMKISPPVARDMIINELMNDPKLPQIMLDQYGNYVIQTALRETKVKRLMLQPQLSEIPFGILTDVSLCRDPYILPLLKLLGRTLLHYRAACLGRGFYKEHT